MVAWQELHIQSNLPLIILAISFICIVIIGFLEFKKVSVKIEGLSEQIKELQVNKDTKQVNKDTKQVNKDNKQVNKMVDKDSQNEDNKVMEQKLNNISEKDTLINEDLPLQDSMNRGIIIDGNEQPVDNIMMGIGMPNIASMIIGGPPMMPVDDPGPKIYEEEIENKKNEIEEEDKYSEIDDKSESECSIVSNDDSENESENESDNDSEDDSENDSENDSDEDDGIVDIELIQGKGKVEEIKEIDRSLSIKELKNICQKLGVSASGNKEQLIKRINAQKK